MRILPLLLGMLLLLSGCGAKNVTTTTIPQTTAAQTQAETTTAALEATTTASETTAAEPIVATDARPFNVQDLVVNDMSVGCSYDLAQQWFGFAPETIRATDDLEGNPIRQMNFGSCILTFSGKDFTLSEAELYDTTLAGPRGISVGDTLADITSMFGLGGDGYPYYESEGGLAPRAERLQFEGDSVYLILLTAPEYAYSEDVLSQELAWMDEPHAQLVYTMDAEKDTIRSIHWILAPLSENRE